MCLKLWAETRREFLYRCWRARHFVSFDVWKSAKKKLCEMLGIVSGKYKFNSWHFHKIRTIINHISSDSMHVKFIYPLELTTSSLYFSANLAEKNHWQAVWSQMSEKSSKCVRNHELTSEASNGEHKFMNENFHYFVKAREKS